MLKAAKYSSPRDHDIEFDNNIIKIGKNGFCTNGAVKGASMRLQCRNIGCNAVASYYPLFDVFQTRHYKTCKHPEQKRPTASRYNSRYCLTLAII